MYFKVNISYLHLLSDSYQPLSLKQDFTVTPTLYNNPFSTLSFLPAII